MPEGLARPGLLAALGEALVEAGELTNARAALEEAAGLARAAGDGHVEWLARVALAYSRVRQEPEGAAEAAFREGRGGDRGS